MGGDQRARSGCGTRGGRRRLRKLQEWGVRYPQSADGEYLRIASRGFRHVKMMVMPRYGETVGGLAVIDALRRRAFRWGIERHPRMLVTDLLQRDGRVAGALALDRSTVKPRADGPHPRSRRSRNNAARAATFASTFAHVTYSARCRNGDW
ncbi:MAG: FAD-binding protein [bacterium]|nr:FAD-binding protein [bacterium]